MNTDHLTDTQKAAMIEASNFANWIWACRYLPVNNGWRQFEETNVYKTLSTWELYLKFSENE